MSAQLREEIADFLTAKINRTVLLGNSELTELEFLSDLVNSYIGRPQDWEFLAEGTGLHETTLRRVASLKETETGEPYNPTGDTIRRLMRFFEVELRCNRVKLKAKFRNQPKV